MFREPPSAARKFVKAHLLLLKPETTAASRWVDRQVMGHTNSPVALRRLDAACQVLLQQITTVISRGTARVVASFSLGAVCRASKAACTLCNLSLEELLIPLWTLQLAHEPITLRPSAPTRQALCRTCKYGGLGFRPTRRREADMSTSRSFPRTPVGSSKYKLTSVSV